MEEDKSDFGPEEGKRLCGFWFDTIIAKLEKQTLPDFPSDHVKDAKYPLFVTWTKGKNDDLRGCIGTFAESYLSKTLGKYAQISAFQDTRFDPISSKEVKKLNVGLSLLCNFTKIDDPLDWVVGKHGIEIDFTHDGTPYSGTYLPEVAEEQGWTQTDALESLVRYQISNFWFF